MRPRRSPFCPSRILRSRKDAEQIPDQEKSAKRDSCVSADICGRWRPGRNLDGQIPKGRCRILSLWDIVQNSIGSGAPYMVRLRPPGLGVKGGPQQRIPIATGPPPGYAASAGARSELAMDCPRGLPTFFQYGAGTSGAAPAPRVPAPGAAPAPRVPASGAGRAARVPASGAAPARPGCRAAAPGVPRRHLGCRGAAARVRAGGRSGARPPPRVPRRGTPGAAAAPQTCAAARARGDCRRGDCYRDTLEVRSRCESPSHLAPPRHPGRGTPGAAPAAGRGTRGAALRHLGRPNLRGGEKPAAGRGTPGCRARHPGLPAPGAGDRHPGCRASAARVPPRHPGCRARLPGRHPGCRVRLPGRHPGCRVRLPGRHLGSRRTIPHHRNHIRDAASYEVSK